MCPSFRWQLPRTLLGLQPFQFLHSAVKPIEFFSHKFQAPVFGFSRKAGYRLLPFFLRIFLKEALLLVLVWLGRLPRHLSHHSAGKEIHRFGRNDQTVNSAHAALPGMSFLLAFSTTDSDKLFGLYKPGKSNTKAFIVIFCSFSNNPFIYKVLEIHVCSNPSP